MTTPTENRTLPGLCVNPQLSDGVRAMLVDLWSDVPERYQVSVPPQDWESVGLTSDFCVMREQGSDVVIIGAWSPPGWWSPQGKVCIDLTDGTPPIGLAAGSRLRISAFCDVFHPWALLATFMLSVDLAHGPKLALDFFVAETGIRFIDGFSHEHPVWVEGEVAQVELDSDSLRLKVTLLEVTLNESRDPIWQSEYTRRKNPPADGSQAPAGAVQG